MARALTSEELTLLRSDTQFSKLYLAIHKPNTVYTALLNGAPASNDKVYEITFDNASGTLSDVKVGMTLYVGTSAGAFDLGMCRIRKAPIAGTFYIGLTSEIRWQDNAYLTVVDDFDLWAKHPTITDEALAMDVDVAYSDQHTAFSPIPVLGPHAVVWLDDATVDVAFDASASWVHGSTISSYAWSAPGASASSGMSTATPTITYNAAGCYRVLCTVTAANGKTTTGVRQVFVYDRDENQPATVFQLAQCTADYDNGGWMFDMEMQAEASQSDIRDRALVVLFAEDWYGATKQSIGPVANREKIVCVGRVVGESIRWDREAGRVHFTVQGFQHWLGKIKSFPVEIYFATDTPDTWSVLPSMTVDRVLTHILYWHSTVVETMDYYRTGDTRLLNEGKTLASTVWGQLQDIAISRLLAAPGVDRFGRLFIEIDPQMVPEASRSWATVMTLTADDWQEGIDLRRVVVNDVSIITLSSHQVNTSGAVSALYSLSPGHVPRRYGEAEQSDRLLADTQNVSNSLAGLLLGWRTNEFPEVPVSFAQNNRMFDLFPRQFAALTIAAGDTPRGIAFDGNLIPRRVALYFDGDTGWMHPEINFEGETFEQPNTDGDIPDIDDLSIPPFPDLDFPPLPDLPPIFPGDPSSSINGPSTVLIADATKGILFSKNFNADDAGDVTWQFWNTGIDPADVPLLNGYEFSKWFICPNGSVWVGVIPNVNRNMKCVYYAPAIGAQFVKVMDGTIIAAQFGGSASDNEIFGMGYNPNVPEQILMVLKVDNGAGSVSGVVILGDHSGFTAPGAILSNEGSRGGRSRVTYGNGEWGYVHNSFSPNGSYFARIAADGASVIEEQSTGPYITPLDHKRAGTGGIILTHNVFDTGQYDLRRSTDGGHSWTQIALGSGNRVGALSLAPDGTYMLGTWGAGYRGRSSDGGFTWSGLPNLPAGGAYAFAYAGDVGVKSRWIAARGIIRYSPNFGDTWYNREGNISYLIPTGLDIRGILVPGTYEQ